MDRLIQELTERADAANAAMILFDGKNSLLGFNDRQTSIYPFVKYSRNLTYRDIVLECIKFGKLANPAVYADPDKWIAYTDTFRNFNDFSQSLTRHSDGRIIQVTYERLSEAERSWYQLRRDVTADFLDHVRTGFDIMIPFGWNGTGLVPGRSPYLVRLLDALPYPAALLTPRSQVIDGNRAFAEILSQGDGPRIAGGSLCLSAVAEEQTAFKSRTAGFFRRRQRTAVTLRASRTGQTTPYFATLSEPPAQSFGWDGPATGVLLLTVMDPDALPAISPRTIAELLQITGSEAEVALALCAGRAAEDLAEERGVERSTVYNQISSIIRKTGLRNQAGIVRQVTTLCWHFGTRI